MKKFVLCLITVLLVVTSVFAAEFKAGVKVDAAGKSDFNIATEDYNVNTLYFSVRPYYTDGHFDVALKLDAGRSFYKTDSKGWYYFLQSYDDLTKAQSKDGEAIFGTGFSVATISYISNYIDRLLFTTGGLQVGFVRDEQLDVTTLATGKYTKTPNKITFNDEAAGHKVLAKNITTDSTCQELSAIVSLDFGEHSIYAFAERFDQLVVSNENMSVLTETFGAEIIVPSIFIKDMHYRLSAIADWYVRSSEIEVNSVFDVYPEIGFELDTTFGEHKFNLTCALESAVYYDVKKATGSEEKYILDYLHDFAGELKANLTLGKFDLTTDVYIVKDCKKPLNSESMQNNPTRSLFRNVTFRYSDDSTATALGGSVGTTYHFGKGHEVSFSTGVVLNTANGFLPFEFPVEGKGLQPAFGLRSLNLGTLDFAKVGVKFGQNVWFRADAEVDYLWYLIAGGFEEESIKLADFYSNIFKLSISAGADLKDIDFEVKVGTGRPYNMLGKDNNLFDLYGSFKCTVDIHN